MKELVKMMSKRDDIAERYDTDDSEVFPFAIALAASRLHFGETLDNHRLPTVAAACGYDLDDHHHALADAEACAWIAREIL